MRKKIGDFEKSEVSKNFLMGKSRDETAEAANVSEGVASNKTREFLERAEATSPEDAAEEFDVAELFNSLRKLGKILDDRGKSAEEVPALVETIEEVLKYIPSDELKDVLPILRENKEHLEAAVRLAEYEQKTGKGHEEILEQIATAETRIRQLTEVVEGLTAEVEDLKKTQKIRAQQSLDDEKARCEAERNELLQTHNATVERIEQFFNTVKTLKDNDMDPSDFEQVRNMIRSKRECGGNPKKLLELAKTRTSLGSQIRRENCRVGKARKTVAKLQDRKEKLETKIARAQPILAEAHALKVMGWTNESLNKAVTLTRQAGKPAEVLARLELLKSSVYVQAEIEKAKKRERSSEERECKGQAESAQATPET